MIHTHALMELSAEAYDEIADKLREAGYGDARIADGAIDMHGLAVTRGAPTGWAIIGTRPDNSLPGTQIDAQGLDVSRAIVSTVKREGFWVIDRSVFPDAKIGDTFCVEVVYQDDANARQFSGCPCTEIDEYSIRINVPDGAMA